MHFDASRWRHIQIATKDSSHQNLHIRMYHVGTPRVIKEYTFNPIIPFIALILPLLAGEEQIASLDYICCFGYTGTESSNFSGGNDVLYVVSISLDYRLLSSITSSLLEDFIDH